jgi:hypothetical protein
MFSKKLNVSALGKVSKHLLLEYKNRSRMTAKQYEDAANEYNLEVDRLKNKVPIVQETPTETRKLVSGRGFAWKKVNYNIPAENINDAEYIQQAAIKFNVSSDGSVIKFVVNDNRGTSPVGSAAEPRLYYFLKSLRGTSITIKITAEYLDIDAIPEDELAEYHEEFMMVMRNGQRIGRRVVVKDILVDIPQDRFSNWWKRIGRWIFYYGSDDSLLDLYDNIEIIVYKGTQIDPTAKIIQYFKEGSVNCLLKPIINWATNCLANSKSESAKKKYRSILKQLNTISIEVGSKGVDEKLLHRITNDIQIEISIERAIIAGEEKYIIESKSTKKPLKHFIFRNTKIDHVELNEYTCLNVIETVSAEELYKIKEKLDDEKIYYTFQRNLNNIVGITTLEKTYQISNEFRDLCNDFEKKTGISECYIDDIDDKELSQFVDAATHYNATTDFQDVTEFDLDDVLHIDMEAAYTQYKLCKFYEGFLGKITDFRKTNKIQGTGLYHITNIKLYDDLERLNKKMQIFLNDNVYTSAELKFLTKNGCTYDILYGCWGVKPLHFDMSEHEFMYKKYDGGKESVPFVMAGRKIVAGIKGYALYTGSCDSHHLNKKFWCAGDMELAQTLGGSAKYYDNNTISISYPKQHNYHVGHITAFITAYQRIQMIEQLMQMDYNGLVRACVDGIYFTTPNEKFAFPFSLKTKKTFSNIAGGSFVSNVFDWGDESPRVFGAAAERENFHKELHKGEGGNGKTHFNLTDKGLVRPLYIAPSWKLATNKANEYKCDSQVWHNILTSDPEIYGNLRRKYNVFIIDEVSMMTESNKEAIFEKFPNTKLIFCGDIGFQAPPFSITNEPVVEINEKGFDKIFTYNTNYRFKCEKLKNMVGTLREMIAKGLSNSKVNKFVINSIEKINDNDIQKLYQVEDMILSRSHVVKDKYSEMFKNMNKWYVTKNTRLYKNGDIVIGDKPESTCEIRHAFTVHSIQGETAKSQLYINLESHMDSRLLYTAISRAKTMDQIRLIM